MATLSESSALEHIRAASRQSIRLLGGDSPRASAGTAPSSRSDEGGLPSSRRMSLDFAAAQQQNPAARRRPSSAWRRTELELRRASLGFEPKSSPLVQTRPMSASPALELQLEICAVRRKVEHLNAELSGRQRRGSLASVASADKGKVVDTSRSDPTHIAQQLLDASLPACEIGDVAVTVASDENGGSMDDGRVPSPRLRAGIHVTAGARLATAESLVKGTHMPLSAVEEVATTVPERQRVGCRRRARSAGPSVMRSNSDSFDAAAAAAAAASSARQRRPHSSYFFLSNDAPQPASGDDSGLASHSTRLGLLWRRLSLTMPEVHLQPLQSVGRQQQQQQQRERAESEQRHSSREDASSQQQAQQPSTEEPQQ